MFAMCGSRSTPNSRRRVGNECSLLCRYCEHAAVKLPNDRTGKDEQRQANQGEEHSRTDDRPRPFCAAGFQRLIQVLQRRLGGLRQRFTLLFVEIVAPEEEEDLALIGESHTALTLYGEGKQHDVAGFCVQRKLIKTLNGTLRAVLGTGSNERASQRRDLAIPELNGSFVCRSAGLGGRRRYTGTPA